MPKKIEDAERYARITFGVEADYSKAPSVEAANEVNEGLRKLFARYGDFGTISKIEFSDYLGNDVAQYDSDSMTLRMINYPKERIDKIIKTQHDQGHWNADSIQDIVAHEYGHAIGEYLKKSDKNWKIRLDLASLLGTRFSKKKLIKLSRYAESSADEFLAEVFSALSVHEIPAYNILLHIYFDDNFKEVFKKRRWEIGNS